MIIVKRIIFVWVFDSFVYISTGAFLPPPQGQLAEKYREELWNYFGIQFNELFTITNMPIKRFADFLYRRYRVLKLLKNMPNILKCKDYKPFVIEVVS